MRHDICFAVSVVVLGVTSCGGSSDLGEFGVLDAGGDTTGGSGGSGSGGSGSGGSSMGQDDGSTADTANADQGSGVTSEKACADLGAAYCKRIATCAPILLSLVWGDEAKCAARLAPSCVKSIGAANTGASAARYETCSVDVLAADCTTLLTRKVPASCRPTGGTVTTGGACGDDWQCESGFCSTPGGQACGTCAARQAAGSTCSDDDHCDYGLNCSGPDGSKTCVAQGTNGSACDDNHPCASPNVCIGKTATAAGTCGPGASPGGMCAANGCDFAQALFCHPLSKVCQKVTFADPGEQCGVLNNGLVACTGSNCVTAGGQLIGTCGAIADDGAACNDSSGPKCKAGARCVGGTCQVPNPASCQ